MTGVHSSSRPTRVRSSRVLPWPRSPSSTTSWPAISARSSCGMTVSSKPCSPGHGSRPSRSAASRLSRISCAQGLLDVAGGAELADGADVGGRGSGGHSLTLLSGSNKRVTSPVPVRVAVAACSCSRRCPCGIGHVVRRLLRPAAPRRRARGDRRGADAVALRGVRRRRRSTTSSAPGTRAPGPTTSSPDPALTWTGLTIDVGGRATTGSSSWRRTSVGGGARRSSASAAASSSARGRWVYVDGDARVSAGDRDQPVDAELVLDLAERARRAAGGAQSPMR